MIRDIISERDSKEDMSEERFLINFGDNLRRLLKDRHMTELDLSRITGISNVLLSKYMRGKVMPSIYKVARIAYALDCSIDDLVFDYRDKH